MNTITCNGLDGSNPLHFLAALGLLRLVDRIVPGVKISWQRTSGIWSPELETSMETDELLKHTADWINVLAKTKSSDLTNNRAVNKCKTDLKKLNDDLKTQKQQAKAEVKRQGIRGSEAKDFETKMIVDILVKIKEKKEEFENSREKLATANGQGIAHFGDIIGVSSSIVRKAGEDAVNAFFADLANPVPTPDDSIMLVNHLPALACDQLTDGEKVFPSRFSFGNGSGGQCLLKDWRTLASHVNPDRLYATLLTGEKNRFEIGLTNLNWDPAANRSYALNWWSPEDKKNNPKLTDVAANALAYVGMGMLTAMPIGKHLFAVGWGPHDGWTWPLWEVKINVDITRSLLAHPELIKLKPNRTILQASGIAELRRSDRIDPSGQGRPYFSPSRPV